jgi:hypothetical protein
VKPGNGVEDKTLATGERVDKEKTTGTENPPLATVNTHPEGSLGNIQDQTRISQ